MADDADFDGSEDPNYKAPKQATLDEMKSKDADDEALNRWKASLLKSGGCTAAAAALCGVDRRAADLCLRARGRTCWRGSRLGQDVGSAPGGRARAHPGSQGPAGRRP